jgi:hypothetical protein
MLIRSALFWDITRRRVVTVYRRFFLLGLLTREDGTDTLSRNVLCTTAKFTNGLWQSCVISNTVWTINYQRFGRAHGLHVRGSRINVSNTNLGYGPDDLVFESRQRQQVLLFSKTSRPALGTTQPPSKRAPRYFPGINWPGHEVGHLHLVLTLRLSGAIPLLPLHAFMTWTGATCTCICIFMYFWLINKAVSTPDHTASNDNDQWMSKEGLTV